ncbi:MAG: carbohydrate kinase [Candidatus Thiodiazotropha taylori]
MTANVVGLGEVLWDMFPSGKRLGGAPANFAYHAKELGKEEVSSSIASCVGNDKLGNEIITKLEYKKINCNHLCIDSDHPTGTVTVEVDGNGLPSYTIEKDVAWDYLPEYEQKFAESTDVVCFGSLAQRSMASHNTIINFLDAMPSSSLKIFDINLRQSYYTSEIIQASLKKSNLLKINDEELLTVIKLMQLPTNYIDALRVLLEMYQLNMVVLTKGEKGSELITKEGTSSFSGVNVTVDDTVGAGDSFTAAVALGLLKNYEINKINEYANLVASFVCKSAGATPKLPENLISLFHS